MRLVNINDYIKIRFPCGGPAPNTVRRWCAEGTQPGATKRGKTWYIDLDIEERTTGNPLVDDALAMRSRNMQQA